MKKSLLTVVIISIPFGLFAQDIKLPDLGEIHGNFQLDAQYYLPDASINAPEVPEKIRNNGYLNLNYKKGNFVAGLRYENYLKPLLGYDTRFTGNGVMYRFAGYTYNGLEVTVGSFYEQFGSGIALRSFVDNTIGIDNALEGLRLRYTPIKGLQLKGLLGTQRNYFSYSNNIVRGLDAELNINSLCKSFADNKLNYTFGASLVSKYQSDNNPIYKLPENVGTIAGRLNISGEKGFFMTEGAFKNNDPSLDNNLTYRTGNALLASAGFTSKWLSAVITGKRNDNFSFRSNRDASRFDLTLSYLPTITRQHAYQLAALYPYATQPIGEIGYQADVNIKIPKGTALGGKYGATVAINYSRMHGLDTVKTNDDYGYRTKNGFLGYGALYFQDINIELVKKLDSKNKITLTYIDQVYNKNVIEGVGGYPISHNRIGIFEHQWKYAKKSSVRYELQHLYSKEDKGSWAMALVEFSLSSHYFISIIDNFNYVTTGGEFHNHDGSTNVKRLHYYFGQLAYVKDALRVAVSYGRQREGIVCVGGICRFVPAANGFAISVSSSF